MDNEIAGILEAIVLRDSLNLYMTRLAEQHKGHPDFEATMQFLGHIYRKFAKVADQKVTTDEMGRITVRPNLRTDFNNN